LLSCRHSNLWKEILQLSKWKPLAPR
jgi:hypothetical protein